MDFPGAVTRLYNLYRIYKAKHYGDKGSGIFIQRYQTPKGASFLYVILGAPKKVPKGKQKDLELALEHSQSSNKLIVPKDFVGIRSYLSMIFPQLVRPEQQIADILKNLLAGLRLELVQNETLKYTFQNPQNPEIMIFDEEKDGQFCFYINFLNLKDSGLILAHERQIEYIRQMLDQDVNPNDMKSLPALRTGTTSLSFKKKSESNRDIGEGHQKLQQVIQQRKSKEEIGKELAYSTTIDSFSPSKSTQISSQESESNKEGEEVKSEEKSNTTGSPGLFGMFGGRPPVKRPPPSSTPVTPTIQQTPTQQTQGQSMNTPIQNQNPNQKLASQPITPKSSNNSFDSIFPPVNPAELPVIEEKEIIEETKKMHSSPSEEIMKLNDRINILESENELLKRQSIESTDKLTQILQQKDQEIENYKAFFSKKDGEAVQFQDQYQKAIEQLKFKEQEIHTIQEQLLQVNENLQFALKKNQELEKTLAEKSIIVQEISKQNSQLDDSIEQLSQERNELSEKVEVQEKQIKEFQDQLKKMTQTPPVQKSPELEAQIIELTEDNEQLAESLKEADMKYKIIFEEHSKLLKEKIKWESKTSIKEERNSNDKRNELSSESNTNEPKKEPDTIKSTPDDKDWDKI